MSIYRWLAGLCLVVPIGACHLALGFEDGDGETGGGAGAEGGAPGVTSISSSAGGAGGDSVGGGGQGSVGSGGDGGMGGAGCGDEVLGVDFSGPAPGNDEEYFGSRTETLSTWGALFWSSNLGGHSGQCVADFCDSKLTLVPGSPTAPTGFYWANDQQGPMVYRNQSGDFAFEVDLAVTRRIDDTQPAREVFSGGGIIVRDEATGRWLMVSNTPETQGGDLHTRVFTGDGQGSSTNGPAASNPVSGIYEGRIVVCRVGTTFFAYRRMATEVPTVLVDSGDYDLGSTGTLQVGFTAHWFSGPDAPQATFQHAIFHPPVASSTACGALLDP